MLECSVGSLQDLFYRKDYEERVSVLLQDYRVGTQNVAEEME